VPASSSLYDRIESVSAWYPMRGVFLGERPSSGRDVARVVRLLSQAVDRDSANPSRQEWARRELTSISVALNRERGVQRSGTTALRFGWTEASGLSDAVSERITPNGLGSIDAASTPFDAARIRPAPVEGAGNFADVSLTTALTVHDWLAIVAEPRYFALDARPGGTLSDLRLYRGYARAVVRNLAVRVGADEQRWGQSPFAAMFISQNALPLAAITIGTDTPITFPWWFRFAGPVRIATMLAELGPSQVPSRARLAGWQVSIQPWSRFELGVAVLAQTGGNGGPPATFFKRVVDLFPIIDAIAPQHSDLQISNKLAGGNLRLRFPAGVDLYYELQIDDFDARRLRSSFVDDAGHTLGARVPILLGTSQLVVDAEYERTSLRLYEHAQFKSGVTFHHRLIGNPLGPNANAGVIRVSWQPDLSQQLTLQAADERRDPSLYMATSDNTRDQGFRFIRLSDDPRHRRRPLTAAYERAVRFGGVGGSLGWARVWRTNGPARNEWDAQITLRSHWLPSF